MADNLSRMEDIPHDPIPVNDSFPDEQLAVVKVQSLSNPWFAYYASKTLDSAQKNYATTEKEFLAVVFACDKFRQYIVDSKVIIHTDHAAINILCRRRMPNQGSLDGHSFFKSLICRLSIEKEQTIRWRITFLGCKIPRMIPFQSTKAFWMNN